MPIVLDTLKWIDRVQFMPREEILKIQRDELSKLLLHSYNNVPYYREIFQEISLVEGNRVDLEKFTNIPILTKEIIREKKEKLHSKDKDLRKWYKNTSGGSTGVPVELIQDRNYFQKSCASSVHYKKVLGKDYGEKEVMLWGSERDIFQGSASLKASVRNYLYNLVLLNSFMMDEDQMLDYVKKINLVRPVAIWSYVDSAYELAMFIDRNGLEVHSPRSILVTAGTVYPDIKTYISQVFKSPVYNQYGSREVGDLACECPKQVGLHVFEYFYVFEILNQDLKPTRTGEIGEVYVTPLINYSMPLIRYRIGDTASWAEKTECACGRFLALINNVHGRITDHFKKKDGTIVHGEYFTHLFYFRPWVRKFQVVQKGHEHVLCFVVKDGQEDKTDMKDIIDKIKLVMGKECNVDFQFVDQITPSKSGKYLYTLSELS
jgi:phenylacetate-CoA ligase